ncbi:hypothetical protein LCGC14_2635630, partial [marine sediment metagenome]
VVLSIPGEYVYREAQKALEDNLNLFIFSSNVSLDEELKLKRFAAERRLLVMGPDCGMSILVKYKWQCEQCYQFQTEDRFIHEVCDVCGIGYLEKFTCPFSPCEKEFNL